MLQNTEAYEHFIYSIAENYAEIDFSKLIVKRKGIHFAFVEGEIYFKKGFRLKVFEAVDFDLRRIESYVMRYIERMRSYTGMIPILIQTIHY